MMRLALTLMTSLMLAGCNFGQSGDKIEASGSGAERHYEVAGFDSISLAGHPDVLVAIGAAPSVRAEGEASDLDDLEIRIRNKELRVGLRDGAASREHSPIRVHIIVPALVRAAIAGSGDIRIDRVQGDRFDAAVEGSGDIEIASMEVRETHVSIAGSGNVRIASGRTQSADVQIAGSGDAELAGIESRTANVSVIGSGDVHVQAQETASVRVVGSGDVTVTGPARCEVRKMGSGDISCGSETSR